MGPGDYMTAADTTNMQAGGKSIFEQTGDALTMGLPSAVISGLSSIYNTGVDVANFFGADADRIDTAKAISDIDANWGDYYQQNREVIDTVGFLGTSFIPGGLAVKGLNALRRGEAFGAFGRALNFTTVKQTQALDAALQTLASPEGSVFTRMNADFLASLGWGAADQAIQAAAFQTAVVATMKASPLLDKDSWQDAAWDIAKTSVIGGAGIGGAIEGLFTNGIIKGATKAISGQGVKYQRLLDALDQTSLSQADKAYSLMDGVLGLPEEVFTDDKVLNFAYKLSGQNRTVALDTSALRTKQLADTVKQSYLKFEDGINNQLADDPSVGKGFANSLLKLVKDGKDQGLDNGTIRQRLGDYLFGLKSVTAATETDITPETLYYFNKTGKIVDANGNVTGTGPLSSKPTVAGLPTYRVLGDPDDLKLTTISMASEHQTLSDAWDAGFDMALRPDGTWSINPKSKALRPSSPSTLSSILRVDSGETGTTAQLSIADIATKESPLAYLPGSDLVRAGDRQFKFSIEKLPEATADSVEHSARNLWASGLKSIDGTVSADDFAVLDRMSSAKNIIADSAVVDVGGVLTPWKDLGNFDNWVFQNKVEALKKLFATGGEQDIEALSYKLNTTPQWIQDVVASKFDTGLKRLADGAPDLRTGWQRDLSSYANRDHVQLEYSAAPQLAPMTDDFGNQMLVDSKPYGDFITPHQAYQYRVTLAQDMLDTASTSVLGADAVRWGAWSASELSGRADALGSGAGLASFSNADYGDILRLAAQDSGKNVHIVAGNYTNAALARLASYINIMKNSPKDIAELVAVVTKMRRSSEKFTVIGPEYGTDGIYIADKRLLKDGPVTPEVVAQIRDIAQTGTQGDIQAFKVNSETVGQFLQEHMAINAENIQKRKVLYAAQGIASNLAEDTLYVPPIDTRKVPYFAFVRPIEGKIFGDSSVSMITAKNAAELQKLASQVDESQFQVIFKSQNEAFFKAKGDYEYSRAINESSVNSSLQKEGKLGDFLPTFEPSDVLEDFVNYHQRAATQLVRDAVSTKYAQTFTELQRLSDQFTAAATSKAEPIGKLFQRTVADPYDDYIKTALDISKRSEFTILHQTNEFLDALGTRAYSAVTDSYRDALSGKIGWEEANSTLQRYGLGAPYTDQDAYKIAQTIPDRNLIKTALQKANMALATLVLRFDAANSLVNIISTPILLGTEMSAIKQSIAGDAVTAGKLRALTELKIPGQDASIPSTTKLLYNAVKNFWGEDKAALLKRYTDNGDVKPVLSLYHEMVGDMSLLPKIAPSDFSKNVDKWTDKIATGFGNNFAEQFTRFVSADVMRQLTDPLIEAGRMNVSEQNAFISVFVNRVQGNYVSSQRPILFQGTLGSALGLFQTYQFNLLQQLFRHVEDRNWASVATMGALQTSVFGLNGLPFFEAINTHLIGNASSNPGHKDIYSTVAKALPQEYGDWLMYGTASALPLFGRHGPSLYTRGDINPRQMTVIPMTPMQVPAVDGTVRFVSNLLATAKKLDAGGAVGATLLEGLEHNSVSRPLAGIAQIAQGYSSTSKGDLIAANNDVLSFANAGRILGAKPLDEAVLLNTQFRLEGYKATDRDAIETLGEAVKTKLRNNQSPTDDEFQNFAGEYAARGGNATTFGAAMQRWSKGANESVLNKLASQVRSPYGQRFIEIMGGSAIPDFQNQQTATPPE